MDEEGLAEVVSQLEAICDREGWGAPRGERQGGRLLQGDEQPRTEALKSRIDTLTNHIANGVVYRALLRVHISSQIILWPAFVGIDKDVVIAFPDRDQPREGAENNDRREGVEIEFRLLGDCGDEVKEFNRVSPVIGGLAQLRKECDVPDSDWVRPAWDRLWADGQEPLPPIGYDALGVLLSEGASRDEESYATHVWDDRGWGSWH